MEKVFGKQNVPFFEIMFNVRNGIQQRKYQFMDYDVYMELLHKNHKLANKQYTVEIFERIHLASAISILRNLKWYEAINQAYVSKNFLAFASSFRGLIESTGDTVYSLQNMSITLAENYTLFCEVLEGRREELVISKELEDLLIHFTHARKLKKGEATEESHKAESAAKYVRQLEVFMKGYLDFYSDLCKIIHPARDSVFAFINEENYSIRIQKEKDKENIEELIKSKKELIELLPQLSFNGALLNLKTLNLFPYINTKTLVLNSVDLNNLAGWGKIETLISRNFSH